MAINSVRRGDRAFRVGGDEFAVILPNADIETGLVVARRMLASALNGGYKGAGTIDPFSLSIGISAFPAPSAMGNLLYRHADAALYWCKRHGRTNAVAYDPGRHGVSPDERSIEDVSAALGTILARTRASTRLPAHLLDLDRRVIGYEGLIRPTDGSPMVDASSLFAAAERVDRTVELDMACLSVVADGLNGLEPGVYLSVNLSPRTLESDQFHPVELTAIFGPSRHQARTAGHRAHRTRGGPGPRSSSAATPPRAVAQGCVSPRTTSVPATPDCDCSPRSISTSSRWTCRSSRAGSCTTHPMVCLRALQELAARWSATIVAEGVETGEQLAAIRELGITAGQGYLLGRPARERRAERLDLEALMPGSWTSRQRSTPPRPDTTLGCPVLRDGCQAPFRGVV